MRSKINLRSLCSSHHNGSVNVIYRTTYFHELNLLQEHNALCLDRFQHTHTDFELIIFFNIVF